MFVNPHGSMGGYQISNSVRLRASASAYFSRTPGVAGNRKTWTWSGWVKRGALSGAGVRHTFFECGTTEYVGFYFDTDDTLVVAYNNGTLGMQKKTTQVFRDPCAWSHIVVNTDTTIASALLRTKIYVNGVEITSFSSDVNTFAQNYDTFMNNTTQHTMGANQLIANWYMDGYLSDTYLIDGQALTPASFGQTDSNGVWVPKAYTGTYGTNGFHLNFKDANLTAGSNVGLGKDVSGNGNYWNTNNISVTAGVTYDSMVDTPTNNYATLNPITRPNNYNVLSNGNLYAIRSPTAGTGWNLRSATLPANGKVYVETKIEFAPAANYGIGLVFIQASQTDNVQDPSAGAISDSSTYGIQVAGTSTYKNVAGATTSIGVTPALNDTLQVAFDIPNGNMWIGVNNTWSGGGNPATGTSPTISGISASTIYFVAQGLYSAAGATGAGGSVCFGQRPWAYSAPAGFGGICTANLPAVAIPKPSNGFKATLDTATNIDASVAAARSGWPAYVDIKKNRSAAASWQWQFSHDSTKEYAIAATSVTNQAKSSNTGANNWVGYSIRIDSAYGTAAGSVTHTNGADTTVTHNVGVSARQMIFLFPRAGGTVVRVYHPDLTAGNLLDLCSAAAQAASTTIKTVTSTSFKIDSATASGTYDYLVISELSGFFKLGAYVGNAALDGTFTYDNLQPKARLVKRYEAGTNAWYIEDTARNTYNPVDAELSPNTNGLETSGAIDFDFLSNGVKCRNSSAGTNNGSYVYGDFAAYPFGGSNVSPAPAR